MRGALSIAFLLFSVPLLDLVTTGACVNLLVEWAFRSGAAETIEEAVAIVEGSEMGISVAVSVVQLLVFGGWWLHVSRRGAGVAIPRPVHAKGVVAVVCLGVSLQVVLSLALTLAILLFPSIGDMYEPIESSPVLQEVSLVSVLLVGVIVPVAEECIYRGVMFRLIRRRVMALVFANAFQALLFAFAHGNAVQSVYTFVVGLVLGALYMRYGRLWLCAVLHIAFNLSSYVLDVLPDAAFVAVVLLCCAGLWFAGRLAGLTRESFGLPVRAAEKPAQPDRP